MLGIAVDALGGGALYLRRAQLAGEQTVLGVIFKVSAGEGRTVDIHARGIQADDAVGDGLCAEGFAEFLHQFHIPSGADDCFGGEGNAAEGTDQAVQSSGAVQITRGRLAYRGDGGRRPAAVQDQIGHILIAQLLQQQFPLGIVIVKAGHVFQTQSVVRIDDSGIGSIYRVGSLHGEGVHHGGRGRFPVGALSGEGSAPVGTGEIGADLPVFHVGKEGPGGRLVGGAGIVFTIDDRAFHRIVAGIDHFVGIFHQLDLIAARFQNIGAGLFGVKGGHILRSEGNGERFALARIQKLGFGKTGQHHVGLLDAPRRIGCGVVDLRHVLARNVSCVRDLDEHIDHTAAVGIAFDVLLKAGIAQAVAKGILDSALIVDEAIGSRGFIIAVAHIDALGILHVIALQVGVSEIARVVIGGRRAELIGISVRETAGGIDFSGQHLADSVEAHSAGAADPKSCVNAFHEAQLHGVGGIDKNDGFSIALAFDQSKQIFLVLRQLQVVAAVVRFGITGGIHVHGQVAALAADA